MSVKKLTGLSKCYIYIFLKADALRYSSLLIIKKKAISPIVYEFVFFYLFSDDDTTIEEETYTKLTPIEHILERTDTYVGSVGPITEKKWIYKEDKLEHRKITYVPALIKIF